MSTFCNTSPGSSNRSARASAPRFVGQGASPEFAKHIAEGGTADTISTTGDVRTITSSADTTTTTGGQFLRDVKAARGGDPTAYTRLRNLQTRGWAEGTDASGGFLFGPQQLPGYIEARRAAGPLRERCSNYSVTSDTVWIVTEGNSVTVQHLAEAATKPDTTGTVAQKVSTVHKCARKREQSSAGYAVATQKLPVATRTLFDVTAWMVETS